MQFPRATLSAAATVALVVSAATAAAATGADAPDAPRPVTVVSLTDGSGSTTPAAEDGLEELAETASSASTVASASRASFTTAAHSGTTTFAPAAYSSAATASSVDDIAVLTAPMATDEFLVAGLTWDAGQQLPIGSRVFMRVQESGEWSDWLETEAEEAQDGGAEGAAGTDPFVTGGAEAIQVQVSGSAAALPSGLALHLVPANPEQPEGVLTETPAVAEELPGGAATAPTEPTEFASFFGGDAGYSVQTAATTASTPTVRAADVASAAVTVPRPAITSRAQWGANESYMSWTPRYVSLKATIVHHTAGTNDYSPAQSASIVRGIYFYHAETRDWGDIGYNFLVDKYGQIFEGRSGSLAAPDGKMPVGAHAAGFNTGTMGISAMGDYTKVSPDRAIFNSMANVISWQYARAGIDLSSPSGIVSPKGQNLPRIFGHRDVGSTSCPGAIYSWLPELIGAVDNQALQLYYLNNSFSTVADIQFRYGATGSETFVGDWDGDGVDTIATREGTVFHVTNQNSYGPADTVFAYGKPGDVILVGDWDGDGKDTLAVRRGREYHVRNSVTSGPADQIVAYGKPEDAVLVGDWDADGQDTFAVRRGAQYFVKNSIAAGNADQTVVYGRPGDTVMVGDWDGDGDDTLAVRRGAEYHVKNSIAPGAADIVVVYGRAGDAVLVGDWDGDGTDTLGVRRP